MPRKAKKGSVIPPTGPIQQPQLQVHPRPPAQYHYYPLYHAQLHQYQYPYPYQPMEPQIATTTAGTHAYTYAQTYTHPAMPPKIPNQNQHQLLQTRTLAPVPQSPPSPRPSPSTSGIRRTMPVKLESMFKHKQSQSRKQQVNTTRVYGEVEVKAERVLGLWQLAGWEGERKWVER